MSTIIDMIANELRNNNFDVGEAVYTDDVEFLAISFRSGLHVQSEREGIVAFINFYHSDGIITVGAEEYYAGFDITDPTFKIGHIVTKILEL